MTPIGASNPAIATRTPPKMSEAAKLENNPATAPDKNGQVKGDVSPQMQQQLRQATQAQEAQTRMQMDAKNNPSGDQQAAKGIDGMSFEKAMAMAMAKEKDDAAKDAMKQAQQKAGGGGGGGAEGAGGAGGGCGGGAEGAKGAQSQDAMKPESSKNGAQNMFGQSGLVGAAMNALAGAGMNNIRNIRQ